MRKERAVQRFVKRRRSNEECLCKHMTYERRIERMKKNEKKKTYTQQIDRDDSGGTED